MFPRLTDWSIALAAALAFTTGVVSLTSGLPQEAFINPARKTPALPGVGI